MLGKNSKVIQIYLKLFQSSSPKEEEGKLAKDVRFLALFFAPSSFLMWAYAAILFVSSDDGLPSGVAIGLAFMHLLCPLFIRLGVDSRWVAKHLLVLCFLQQIWLNCFTGGFNGLTSPLYGVIPLLAGTLLGIRSALVWSCLIVVSVTGFLLWDFYGLGTPLVLAPLDMLWITVVSGIGYFGLMLSVVAVFLLQQEEKEEQLRKRGDRIDNLLRILTHDVSNSLNIIQTASTLYKLYDEDQARIDYYFSRMDLASSHIKELIDSVKVLRLAETDRAAIDLRPTCLLDAVEYCIRLLADRLVDKKITFDLETSSFSPCAVMADPSYLINHVLMNVLTNAVKFSHVGGRITVRAQDMGKHVALKIRDYGVGMDDAELEDLFREKHNKSRPGTADERGSGFGMLIIKSFMDCFDGQVTVERINADEGSGIEVTLVFDKAPRAEEASLLPDFQGNNLGLCDLVVKSV